MEVKHVNSESGAFHWIRLYNNVLSSFQLGYCSEHYENLTLLWKNFQIADIKKA